MKFSAANRTLPETLVVVQASGIGNHDQKEAGEKRESGQKSETIKS